MSEGDGVSRDLSRLETFMAENNAKSGGFEIPDAGVSCSPPRNTVFCQPGTCTRTIIIVSVE
jgi:hypothetical protein